MRENVLTHFVKILIVEILELLVVFEGEKNLITVHLKILNADGDILVGKAHHAFDFLTSKLHAVDLSRAGGGGILDPAGDDRAVGHLLPSLPGVFIVILQGGVLNLLRREGLFKENAIPRQLEVHGSVIGRKGNVSVCVHVVGIDGIEGRPTVAVFVFFYQHIIVAVVTDGTGLESLLGVFKGQVGLVDDRILCRGSAAQRIVDRITDNGLDLYALISRQNRDLLGNGVQHLEGGHARSLGHVFALNEIDLVPLLVDHLHMVIVGGLVLGYTGQLVQKLDVVPL